MSEELVVVFYLIIIKKAQGQGQTNDSQGQRARVRPPPWAGVAEARALAGVAGRGASDRGRCDWSGGRWGVADASSAGRRGKVSPMTESSAAVAR